MQFWGEAVITETYIRNRSPSSSIQKGTTHYELFYRKKPSLSHLKTFGCQVYYTVAKEIRKGKLDIRSRQAVFIGYTTSDRIYKIWNGSTMRTVITEEASF